jgi:hypothetical protein
MIKKLLISFLILFILALILVVSLFIFPQKLINQTSIEWLIHKSEFFDQAQFESMHISHQFHGFSNRTIQLDVKDFCFNKRQDGLEIQGCLMNFQLEAELELFPTFKMTYPKDLIIQFSSISLIQIPKQEQNQEEKQGKTIAQLNLIDLWSLSSHPLVPPIQLKIEQLSYTQDQLQLQSQVEQFKNEQEWLLKTDYFSIVKNESHLHLEARENLLVPMIQFKENPLVLQSASLIVNQQQESFHFSFSAEVLNSSLKFETSLPAIIPLDPLALLESMGEIKALVRVDQLYQFLDENKYKQWPAIDDFKLQLKILSEKSTSLPRLVNTEVALEHPRGQLKLDINTEIHSLMIKDLILHTQLQFFIKNFKQDLNTLTPMSFDWLPAPFNALEGSGELNIHFEEGLTDQKVLLKHNTQLDFKSVNQAINLSFLAQAQIDLQSYAITDVETEIVIGDVTLVLPYIDTRSLPPQFLPDSRINRRTSKTKPKPQANPIEFDLRLKTTADKPITLKSNLVDEPIRLALAIDLLRSQLQKAFIQVLPLKTTIFRRPLVLEELTITLFPEQEAFLKGTLHFRFPEYLVTLDFEGPSSNVQTQLKSSPPLPLDDIYSVLLFGRPMMDLDDSARDDAGRGARMLSQGLLSLTTLYFFAGTPVQSLGYNPDRGQVEAQFGIGKNSSLRLSGGGNQGDRAVGIRRSLGAGWFIDTSVNQNTQEGSQTETIMLERIHAY